MAVVTFESYFEASDSRDILACCNLKRFDLGSM